MTRVTSNSKSARTGRPTSEESRQLDQLVIREALQLFLERGYDGASMEAVAQRAGISKRTLYARYGDKSELFLDALRWSMKDWVEKQPRAIDFSKETLESALLKVAKSLLDQALHPTYIKLGRIVAAKAEAFHEEQSYNYDMARSPRIRAVLDVLNAYRDELDEACLQQPEITAELFVSLISGIPARLASFGTIRKSRYEQQRIKLAVQLFAKSLRKSL